MQRGSAAAVLASIAEEHERLRTLLSGREEGSLAERPPSGKWSALEHMRHMAFAEYGLLARLSPGDPRSRCASAAPHAMRVQGPPVKMVLTSTPSSMTEVLDAWAWIHEMVLAACEPETPELPAALARNLRHLRGHILAVERLLRAPR